MCAHTVCVHVCVHVCCTSLQYARMVEIVGGYDLGVGIALGAHQVCEVVLTLPPSSPSLPPLLPSAPLFLSPSPFCVFQSARMAEMVGAADLGIAVMMAAHQACSACWADALLCERE